MEKIYKSNDNCKLYLSFSNKVKYLCKNIYVSCSRKRLHTVIFEFDNPVSSFYIPYSDKKRPSIRVVKFHNKKYTSLKLSGFYSILLNENRIGVLFRGVR